MGSLAEQNQGGEDCHLMMVGPKVVVMEVVEDEGWGWREMVEGSRTWESMRKVF